jgi:peptide deformylase
MTIRADDVFVQKFLADEFDTSVLHVPLFPVNMRLYKTSDRFRKLVLDVVDYMEVIFRSEVEGYTQPRGISGANLGVPWNIVGVRRDPRNLYMLNPVVVGHSEESVQTLSNCGSLRLPEPIPVSRWEWVDVEYYDFAGEKVGPVRFRRADQGFTVQHEIDHNIGVLITDHS